MKATYTKPAKRRVPAASKGVGQEGQVTLSYRDGEEPFAHLAFALSEAEELYRYLGRMIDSVKAMRG